MTNSDLTLIGILVDRSGSMWDCKDDMQGGINTFLKEQASQPGQLEVTLAQFDTEYEMLWKPTRITEKHVPTYTLVPRGGTALLDSLGRFVTETGRELSKRAENDRPGNVIILVVTDGYENSSREWNKSRVKNLIEQQTDKYNWQFTYLGANQDAIVEGGGMGFNMDSSLTYTTNNAPIAFAAASNAVTNVRSGLIGNVAYTAQNRVDAVADEDNKAESKAWSTSNSS